MSTKKRTVRVAPKRPIAQRLRHSFRSLLDRQVVDLAEVRAGRENAERLLASRGPVDDELDPSHAVYVEIMNLLSVLCEQLTSVDELARHADVIGAADDEYQPSWPPVSPISTSLFNTWSMLDVGIGIERETIATIVLDLGDLLGLSAEILTGIELLARSRLGLYVHEGALGERVILRELITGSRVAAVCSSGHVGTAGELWLVRLLSPVLPELDYHVAFTSPYVIALPGEPAWLDYFHRTLPKTKITDSVKAYEMLMKYGLGHSYWNEYIFEGYWSHTDGMIGLLGLPDVPASRPQSHEVQGQTAKLEKYYGPLPL